jgi:DNA-binding CsgD family transcriptional regulator/PAS domain-containing protein
MKELAEPHRMPNLDERRLDRQIADLYEAATTDGLWDNWLSSTAGLFGSDSGLAVIQEPVTGRNELVTAYNMNAQALQLYGEYYHRCDLWTQRSARTLMKAAISADLCTDEEFANSEMYVDFSRRYANDQFYVVGAVLPVERTIGVIGFQNARKSGPFERHHARALDRLLPHLQRALIVRARLGEATARNAASEAALEALVHGVAMVSLDGALVYANAAARDILGSGDGMALGSHGRLSAARPDETRSLLAIIAGCGRPTGGGALTVSRPSGLRPLEVIAAPLSGATSSGATFGRMPARAGAVLFLRDPESQPRPMPEMLAVLYGLTPAEAQLAAGLVSYRTLEQIAAEHRLSRETLRTQLKQLFAKTGTNRQSELVGFLASGIAALLQRRRVG